MKTAMQELMNKVQSINERYELTGDANWLMNEIIDHIENSLEKEKEQIIEAYEEGKQNGIDSITNIHMYIIGEKYYNETYTKTNNA